jgi:hypothetical protein
MIHTNPSLRHDRYGSGEDKLGEAAQQKNYKKLGLWTI